MTVGILIRRALGRTRRGADGMTVLELTIAAALVMVMIVPVLAFVSTTQRNQNSNYNATGQQADARLALQELGRFLREAEYPAGTNYSSAGSDLFATTPTSDDMAFYSEIGAVTGSGLIDRVEYSLSGTTLTRTVVVPTLSGGTWSYTGTPSSRAVLGDVMNDNPANCTNYTAPVTLFSYSYQDPSSGAILPMMSVTATTASQVNYVQMTLLIGPPTGQTGACTRVQTAVSLRNWRP